MSRSTYGEEIMTVRLVKQLPDGVTVDQFKEGLLAGYEKRGFRCKQCGTLVLERNQRNGVHVAGYCSTYCISGKTRKERVYKYKGNVPIAKNIKRHKKKKNKKVVKVDSCFYETREWQELRYRVLKKYSRKCMVCFRTNLELHVDHIKPISRYPELALDEANLQVLCRDCNLGKGNKDEIDWRPK